MTHLRTHDNARVEAEAWDGRSLPNVVRQLPDVHCLPSMPPTLMVPTPEGLRGARPGEWLVRDQGAVRIVKPDVFAEMYRSL